MSNYIPINFKRDFFRSDGATGHRIISQPLWPARCPDLAYNFFLFGYLKNSIFRNTLHTLWEVITQEITNLTVKHLQGVFNNLKWRKLIMLWWSTRIIQELNQQKSISSDNFSSFTYALKGTVWNYRLQILSAWLYQETLQDANC